jgi:hypothetical protein
MENELLTNFRNKRSGKFTEFDTNKRSTEQIVQKITADFTDYVIYKRWIVILNSGSFPKEIVKLIFKSAVAIVLRRISSRLSSVQIHICPSLRFVAIFMHLVKIFKASMFIVVMIQITWLIRKHSFKTFYLVLAAILLKLENYYFQEENLRNFVY